MKQFAKISFLVALISCESEVEIERPAPSPEIVLNGFIDPDQTVKIALSRSWDILSEENPQAVNGAEVNLFENGELVGLMKETTTIHPNGNEVGGIYTSEIVPSAGNLYEVEVTNSGLPDVSASTRLPEISSSFDARIIEAVEQRDGRTSYSAVVSVVDDPAISNYYELILHHRQTAILGYAEDGSLVFGRETGHLDYDSKNLIFDPANNQGLFSTNSLEVGIFNDDLFGEAPFDFVVTFELYGNNFLQEEHGIEQDSEVIFELRSLSYEYYQYKLTATWQRGQGTLGEPVQVFENIDGGLGIFASYSTDVVGVFVEK